jgi:hypothetical protein
MHRGQVEIERNNACVDQLIAAAPFSERRNCRTGRLT